MSSLLLLIPLLLLLFSSPVLSAVTITHLPGFSGPLPFHLETGYVGVGEKLDVELFYYFIESEGNPSEDPVLLWLNGGPRCSALSGLVFEIGPLKFVKLHYNGSLPTLVLNHYSWTKVSNIIFLDYPVESGFSFSNQAKTYEIGDVASSEHVCMFLIKWYIDHPKFLSNPLYIGGDSYGGKIVPIVTHKLSQGIEARHQSLFNLKGYLVGNPATGEKIDYNSRIPYAHGVGIIPDKLYRLINRECEGEEYHNPRNPQCVMHLNRFKQFISEINAVHILEPSCPFASPNPKDVTGERRRYAQENHAHILQPPLIPNIRCREYGYYLSYYWANNYVTRESLHIKKGTVSEWVRCKQYLPYKHDIPSTIGYHLNLTSKGYRALVYSGDHDLAIPFSGTQAWIESLNFSTVDNWRSWHVAGQVAGYTISYSNNLTFATIKGAGHTAPEYRPRQCLHMLSNWISNQPL